MQKIAGFQVIVLSMILQESVGYRGVEKGGREQTVRLESEQRDGKFENYLRLRDNTRRVVEPPSSSHCTSF